MEDIRKYRFNFNTPPFFNNQSQGIALFDLIGSFVIAYILDHSFNISRQFPNKQVYYLSIIPLGIIIHLMFGINTFLNQQLFNSHLNIYKITVALLIYMLFNQWTR